MVPLGEESPLDGDSVPPRVVPGSRGLCRTGHGADRNTGGPTESTSVSVSGEGPYPCVDSCVSGASQTI